MQDNIVLDVNASVFRGKLPRARDSERNLPAGAGRDGAKKKAQAGIQVLSQQRAFLQSGVRKLRLALQTGENDMALRFQNE